jgi:uncharacterized protein
MSSRLPNEKECIDMLRAAGCSEKVVRHCCTVNLVAMTIARACDADQELVNAGSWLHDIGRAVTHGARHVSEGVIIARRQGLPESLVLIISRHIAAGLTDEEATMLGLPPGEYMPETLEEKIVCHADNLVGDVKILTLEESVEDSEVRGYLMTGRRMRKMHQELSEACGVDLDLLMEESDVRKKAARKCALYASR